MTWCCQVAGQTATGKKMIKYKQKGAPTAVSKEQNRQKEPKANRIAIGVDAHLKSYQAARKIDNGAVGVAQTLGSKEALLLYAEKQREQAQEVAVLYEAGPFGLTLYQPVKGQGNHGPGLGTPRGGAHRERAQEQPP